MICDEVVQRLPWFLNGTLPPAEASEVRDHLASCAACRAALAETRSAYRIFTAHVPAQALVDYAWGQVPERLDIGLIERHLEECPECAAELELIRTSRQLADEPQVALFERRTRPAPPAPRRAWQVSALAAALGGVVALTGWIHSDRQRNALEGQLGETRQTVAIMTSDLAGIRTQVEKLRQAGGGSTPETTTAPPAPVAPSGSAPAAAALLTGSAAHLSLLGASLGLTARGGPDDGALDAHAEMGTLELQYSSPDPLPKRFEVELSRGGRKLYATRVSPKIDPASRTATFTLGVKPSALGAGTYTAILYGTDGSTRTQLDTFDFAIR